MTDGFVADSSVGIAWSVNSQSSEATEELLTQVTEGSTFVVPSLWMLEVSNALHILQRRGRVSAEQGARARKALALLMPIVDEEGPRLALEGIFDLANRHVLSVYDATYLELAIRRRLPLASRDTDLNAAARARGVKVLL